VPLDWATTQNNLGIALSSLGEREAGTARLEQAVNAFREALKERTRKRVPLNWAATQNNLGIALSNLGEREAGTARLEQAVNAFREALKERTSERVPLDWATSTGNQGVAFMLLAERLGDADMAKVAIQQIDVAFTMMKHAGHAPFSVFYKAKLSKACALLNQLAARWCVD
jgi:tetratricopeptide (TPR) repeat protein